MVAALQLIKMGGNNSLQLKNILADHERRKSNQRLNFIVTFIPLFANFGQKLRMFSVTNILIQVIQGMQKIKKYKKQFMNI